MNRILMQQEGGGAGGGDWRSALPEEQRTAAYLKDVPDLPTLVKNYGEALAYRGASIRIPGPDAGPEARKEFLGKLTEKVPELVLLQDGEDDAAKAAREAVWSRLGRPKEAKEYGLPEGLELPEATLAELRAAAAEEGLTRSQFQARAQRVATALGEAGKASAAEVAALKRELGDAYQERLSGAAEAARKLGADDAMVKAIQAGQAPAAYVRQMISAAKALGEVAEVAGQGAGGGGKMTPGELKAKRAEMMARPEYFKPRPGQMDIHRDLVEKVQDINRKLAEVE